MFETIVVGVDGREGGRDALQLAAALGRPFASRLVAVHAYSVAVFGGDVGIPATLEVEARDAALDTLDGELARAEVRATPEVVPDGSPGRALQLAATRHRADLIVVGSAHRGRLGRVFAGDVSVGTLHGAPCPVLVAPSGFARRPASFGTIGVAFDGSIEARAAAELARDVAVATGARLRVIAVVAPADPGGPFEAYRPDWAELGRARRERAQAEVETLAAGLGADASAEIVVGDPVRELAHAANELDLLVTGSRGYGPVRRVMLGSTSGKLVHGAPCPVLVVARGAEPEPEEAQPEAAAARAAS